MSGRPFLVVLDLLAPGLRDKEVAFCPAARWVMNGSRTARYRNIFFKGLCRSGGLRKLVLKMAKNGQRTGNIP